MVAAHGNSLRSIIMYLDKLTSQEVTNYFLRIAYCPHYIFCSLPMDNYYYYFFGFVLGEQVINLELSTGIPLLYIYKHGKFLKRGSPVGPTEAGVYAYTRVWTLCPLLYLVLCSVEPWCLLLLNCHQIRVWLNKKILKFGLFCIKFVNWLAFWVPKVFICYLNAN